MDAAVNFVMQSLLIVFGACVILLTPFWAWFIFRLYVPKAAPKQKERA